MAFAALLPGCALFRTETVRPPVLAEAKQSLYALKAWRMEGRIGVQTSEDAWQANLFWDHDAAQDRLRVSGPLSQGMVSIIVQKDLIYINEGNGVTELSRNPDAKLRERLGFAVPLSSLRYWMLGIPAPGLPYDPIREGDDSPSGFRQSGWAIRVERFINVGSRTLPQKMLVEGSGVRLKIVTDNWEIGA
jgi:outer membrane lipoprotein LolB